MIDRFTQKAREAIRLAVETAAGAGTRLCGGRSICFLGLIKEETGRGGQRFWQNMM